MIQLLTGDCRTVLPTLPDASVHMVCTSPPYYALRSYLDAEHPDKAREIGSEATPDAFIAEMVRVFREVRRVLRDDGTVWLNLGDSYNASTHSKRLASKTPYYGGGGWQDSEITGGRFVNFPGLAPKQLLLMPARVALALQADGWWVRSDIIWQKPNPMPESCRDRPTSAHEHVFLLSKRSRYFYDADAVREEAEYGRRGRNLRNVWEIATHPYSAAHFATFPPTLAERCIRAGTSERGCCAACGKPWVRVTERSSGKTGQSWHDHERDIVRGQRGGASAYTGADRKAYEAYGTTTTGWSPSCQCNAEVVPATVLDPFSGAGTTALVADRLDRNAIGIDLSHAYVEMARERLVADCPLFAELSPPPATYDAEDQAMADLFAWAAK